MKPSTKLSALLRPRSPTEPGQAMRIAFVTQQLRQVLSGPGLYANNVLRSLVRDGHQVVVVAPEDERPELVSGYKFIGVRPPILRTSQARWLSLSFVFARALRQLERAGELDLVHFTDAREAFFYQPAISGDQPRPAVIGNVNDTYAAESHQLAYYRRNYHDWHVRWAYYRALRLAERRAYHQLDVAIANSQFTAQVVAERYAIPSSRLLVCHKSVDVARFADIPRRRAAIAPHPPTVLFVGGNMQRKGLSTLIRAAPAIRAVLPGVEFWVVGRDRAEARMRLLGKALGVAESFHFLGLQTQAQLLDLYARADAFAMPSLSEAFGVVFLEAMAAGVPTIGTRVGGIPEIIRHGENGLLVEPEDATGLANTLIEVLTRAELRERLRLAGPATVVGFDVADMMLGTYAAYGRALANRDERARRSTG